MKSVWLNGKVKWTRCIFDNIVIDNITDYCQFFVEPVEPEIDELDEEARWRRDLRRSSFYNNQDDALYALSNVCQNASDLIMKSSPSLIPDMSMFPIPSRVQFSFEYFPLLIIE